LQIVSHAAQRPADIDAAFAAMTSARGMAVAIATDPFLTADRAHVVRLASTNRLPTIAGLGLFVESGAVLSYGPSLFDLYRRAAVYVDKILRGAKPADLPVEQPTKFELVINLGTAKALGLAIPQSILLRADRVIQ